MRLALACLLVLPACDMGHLGNPLLWPAQAVSTGVENSAYNARRARVKSFVVAHQPDIVAQALSGGGPQLDEAYGLARVPAATRRKLTARIREDIALYRDDAEALTVALMVHGG